MIIKPNCFFAKLLTDGWIDKSKKHDTSNSFYGVLWEFMVNNLGNQQMGKIYTPV